ncbi:SWIB domain-containing protein/GYF domain-containing protein/Plus-3 domain-containing protein [Cephalotus follicularis]|uniref:SWIB domain-containing protein/GYF domain-containing protein/Plus-3 domain-containing protein n=1 Tax=Cephalotus follicularis TaxID=3775 RepID=A0A1Q3AXH9_CEPFO|nr:SWIB domain-containing protein/GYF domain-containing protein/Plus-3 domain-containing protein [Cephalotus follicularis]
MEAEEEDALNTNDNNYTKTATDMQAPPQNTEPQLDGGAPESQQSPPPQPQSESAVIAGGGGGDDATIKEDESVNDVAESRIGDGSGGLTSAESPEKVTGEVGDEDLIGGEQSKVSEPMVEAGGKEDKESIDGDESKEVVSSCESPVEEPPVSGNDHEKDAIDGEEVKVGIKTEEEETEVPNCVTEQLNVGEEMEVPDVKEKAEADEVEEREVNDVVEETEVDDVEEKLEMDGIAVAGEKEEPYVAEEREVPIVAEERGVAEVAEKLETEETVMPDLVKETVGAIGTEEMAMREEREMAGVTEESNEVENEVVADVVEGADGAQEIEMDDDPQEAEMDKAEGTATEAADEEEVMAETGAAEAAKEGEMMEDEAEMANVVEEMETTEGTEAAEETEVEEASRSGSGKRKRGKITKASAKGTMRKKVEEDVCFICFDGGDLVLCDRRGCPKAYHPSCVNRDEAFFQTKGRWNCGWHLCSNCEKNAYYMCYTCTFSLCKSCIKNSVILCVRGNRGFCETCMKTVMLIGRNEQENRETAQVDFDDKSSWEYLFKDYWIDLKERLCLTSDELAQAKNPWKGSDLHAGKRESPDEIFDANNDGGSASDSSAGNAEAPVSKRRKAKKRSKSRAKGDSPSTVAAIGGERTYTADSVEWASKELLEFVMHMKNGEKSVLSQFDVQALLLEYIKRNKLRDPRRKSQIICDARLQNLFGKQRVGHFEMLKLLESHFLTKEDSQADDLQGSVVDTEANQSEPDGNSDVLMKAGKDKRRKTRKKGDGRGLQSNVDDYAAIDMHNINLIYLRRNLVEDILEDTEFHDKVVGSFVRIRISGNAQKQDLYRLVQVVGTNKVADPYRVGKKMTDYLLEILNLNKTEAISIDIISNQEFTEDECKRLRQSIKCGLINRLTVGDIQEKAMTFQAVRVKDWLETETMRLSHLRDRASDLGKRKELRECVEKLQLLKSPEERQRRLEEIPEIHADPNMDPSHESDEDETNDKRQENYMRPRGSGFSRRMKEPISPRKGDFASNESWGGTRNHSSMNRELSRNLSDKGFLNKGVNAVGAGEIGNENLWIQGRDKETQQLSILEKPKLVTNSETGARETHSAVISQSSSKAVSEISQAPPSTLAAHSAAQINETEKIWHYKDPSGKVQGPFSIVQLRKWNNNGYFPTELRIWRTNEKQDDSILLTDALTGKFHKDPSSVDNIIAKAQVAHSTVGESWKSQPEMNSVGRATPSLEVQKYSTSRWGSETNLPSPTPNQTTTGGTKGPTFENQWSPTPAQPGGSFLGANSLSGSNGGLQPPAVVVPESSKLIHSHASHVLNIAPKTEMGMPQSSTNGPHIHSQPTMVGELSQVQVNAHLLPGPDAAAASMNSGGGMKNVSAILQNLVQSSGTRNLPVGSQAWGSVSVGKPDMFASSQLSGVESQGTISMPGQPAYGQWGNVSSSAPIVGNVTGVFPAQGSSGLPPSDPWRPPVPVQSNTQPPTPPNVPWGMGVNDNHGATARAGPENQNTNWGQVSGNPIMGWGGGPAPANANPGWVAHSQGPVPGNANPTWVPPGQLQAPAISHPGWAPPGQGQVPGNAVPNWDPPGNAVNANPGWVSAGQGPPPGNANQGWGVPTLKPGMWGNEQNNSGDRFSGQRDRGPHGGDSGFGGGKTWSRQSSFGGGGVSSRPSSKGQRVCKYHESGRCRRGSSCDYMHT